jgi:hypothetical protein
MGVHTPKELLKTFFFFSFPIRANRAIRAILLHSCHGWHD